MSAAVVVFVNGAVLANDQGTDIACQRKNAAQLAEGLLPLFASGARVVVMHGNKPQVGFVLFRSELTSHVLHGIPLDVCGADTQGATGFMLLQAFTNVLRRHKLHRPVMCVLTQTRVKKTSFRDARLKAIGPCYDREKADQYRQTRGWMMVEEPGRGYRRAVPSLPPQEIIEFDGIRQLVEMETIVIAAGGGGVPVMENTAGDYEGIEAVLETGQVAVLMAKQLKAHVLLNVVESEHKFIQAGLDIVNRNDLGLDELDQMLAREVFLSTAVRNKLTAASTFLHHGGEQVIITTLRHLPDVFSGKCGLHIGQPGPSVELFHPSAFKPAS